MKYLLAIASAFILTSCGQATRIDEKELSLVSEEQEIGLGTEFFPILIQTQGGKYLTHENLYEYIQKIGLRLAKVSDRPHLPFEFEVVNLSIPYAWSLPGGKIAISRGMLLLVENEAELAGIIAHEIAHSTQNYRASRSILLESHLHFSSDEFTRWNDPLFYPFSNEMEMNADKLAIKYMVSAGYDPAALLSIKKTLLERKSEDECDIDLYFSTHPFTENRLGTLHTYLERYRRGGYVGKQAFIDAIKPLRTAQVAYEQLDGGSRALESENINRALELAEEGLAKEPNEALLHHLKGKALLQLEYYPDALEAFTTALSLNPSFYELHLHKGEALYRLGEYENAKENIMQAQALFPSSEGHYLLGKLFLEKRNFAKALLNFQISAHAHSTFSKKAQENIDIVAKAHPPREKNILVSVEKVPDGDIKIHLRNISDQKVKNILLRIDLVSPPHKMLVAKEIKVPGEIKPNSSRSIITSIGPFHQKISQAHFIEALVVSSETD